MVHPQNRPVVSGVCMGDLQLYDLINNAFSHIGTSDLDGWLRMGLLPPLGNFADISYLVEN